VTSADACTRRLEYARVSELARTLAETEVPRPLHRAYAHAVAMTMTTLLWHGEPALIERLFARLEHVEIVNDETPARMARLGITASVQPVHADPAIQPNWRTQLGDDRVERGYPWPSFTAAGARLAFGTDAPTAPHEALVNIYIATTRRSATDRSLPANLPKYVIPLASALRHATLDSAASFDADTRIGRVRTGMYADLVVLDGDILDADGDLLSISVARTIVGGRTVFKKE